MSGPESHVREEMVKAIKELGLMALEAQAGRLHTRIKQDGTSVTQVDREVERALVELLQGLCPQDGVMGEEGGMGRALTGRRLWVIDPIDGTTNFRFGLPIWALSVGLLEGGVPLWGCVYLPALDWLYLAGRGEGATCNGEPIHPLVRTHLHAEDILGITSEGVKDWDFQVPAKIRALGSAAAQACFVASGVYVGYFVERWHIWDLAAALLVAMESGVRVADRRGKQLDRFGHIGPEKGPPVLFAAQGVHGELLARIHPRAHWHGKDYLD
jgi:fructose-1,6-bisphosphatase/inositol monophosphatase family enzyme